MWFKLITHHEKERDEFTKTHRKSPRKLLVKDQSTRPTQLQIKNGREIQDGWLIPTTN